MMYIVYEDNGGTIDYPSEFHNVVGVCTSESKALKMVQAMCERIEKECKAAGDTYTKTENDDEWGISYAIDNSIDEWYRVFYCKIEPDTILIEES